MRIFDKLFNNRSKQTEPDNTRLLQLINVYQKKNGKGDSYNDVVSELMNGNSFLLLPSQNSIESSGGWTITDRDTTLRLTSVYNLDGLKVLGAFTDENTLLS